MSTELLTVRSRGVALETDAGSFGELQVAEPTNLSAQLAEHGYLYLRGLLDRDEILAGRQELLSRLAADGAVDQRYPLLEGVAHPEYHQGFRPDIVRNNPPIEQVLYSGRLLAFFEALLGGPIRHYDFTWLRAVAPGLGTTPHCDLVYMGRGTQQLFTAWVPFGDITLDIGGLMVLEGSHRKQDQLRRYLERDVDEYCENLPRGQEVAAGKRNWEFDGTLAKDPRSLRQKLGGRWLTAPEFRMGDVMVFGMFLVHGSLDNQSDRIRLSTDSRYQLASEPVDERWVGPNPIGHSRAGKRGRVC